jgi:peptidyl-prolyl cis-trans isomerase SurA
MRSIILLGGALLVFFSGFSQDKKGNTKSVNLVTIGKESISVDEFSYLYSKNNVSNSEKGKNPVKDYLQLYTNFKLKVLSAKALGIDTTKAFKEEFSQYKAELQRPYLSEESLIDSLVLLTYERMKEQVRAAHILLTISPEAPPEDTLLAYKKISKIRKEILEGLDFNVAASKYSQDPSAKNNGGDLGYFSALQMVYPFETAAYSTPVGEVSEPIRTRFGYHLIKVIDRRPTQGEIEVSHILIGKKPGIGPEALKNLAFEVYDQVQAGVPWEEVCNIYSDDESTKSTGGRLRPFTMGMMTVQAFEEVAFSLERVGQVSDPFETNFGWHIVRLEGWKKLQPLEQIEESLKAQVTRDERTSVSKDLLKYRLRTVFNVQINQKTKVKLQNSLDSSFVSSQWNGFKNVKPSEVLFKAQKHSYTVAEFNTFLKEARRQASIAPIVYFEMLFNAFIDSCMDALQDEKLRKEHPVYAYLEREYYEGILLFEIMEREVWRKASEDTVGQKAFFEQHGNLFMAPERANAHILSGRNSASMDKLEAIAKADDRNELIKVAGDLFVQRESGYYSIGEKEIMSNVPWQPGVYRFSNDGSIFVIWIEEILPAGKMKFEEAKSSIITEYQTYLENEWVNTLKKKYPVKIDKKGLKLVETKFKG